MGISQNSLRGNKANKLCWVILNVGEIKTKVGIFISNLMCIRNLSPIL